MRDSIVKTMSGLTMLLTPWYVNAEMSQWSVGVAAAYSPAVYKDTPSNRTVIPIIGYEGEHLFFRGFDAGYRLLPIRSQQNLILRLAYDPRTLQPNDSDDPQIRQLNKRKSTILGGVSYQHRSVVGLWEATIGSDIAGRHDGVYAEVAWRFPLRFERWGITPSVGYAYNSDKLNNHFYGVSAQESLSSGLEQYNAGWSGQYFISAMAYWSVSQHVRISGGLRYTNLDSDVSSSPVIGRDSSVASTLGVVYLF
ncbi:MipA/OmpV family protein [Vibrio metschnikovii]|uniref:MipA/OmpV family protein n=1 Tax=Vibrio metschnikovii TaxID=28172 RepID=UPI001C2FF0ED|nr:MipA/OmpV family protein [Vibrio metschnikovii]